MQSMKSILKRHSFKALLIAVLCVVATQVADAKTVSSSYNYLDESTLNYVENIYARSNYKYSVVANEYISSGYNYISYYYICLTNDSLDTTNTTSITSNCEELYRFYRTNNAYSFETISDNSLIVNNSIYYYFDNKNYFSDSIIYIICIFVVALFFYQIFKGILMRC